MKLLPLCITSLLAGAVALTTTGISFADDGEMFRKNVSKTPELETDHGALRMLPLYVPAQNSSGVLVPVEYFTADDSETSVETREFARPLIAHYTDGHAEGIDEEGYGGFPGHGERDAFAAVSLDDGGTWVRTNLSESANLSSFSIQERKKWVPYPGDVGRTAIASDGNQVLVVWVSRYASGGSPNYAMSDDEIALLETHFGYDAGSCSDLFNEDGSIYSLTTLCLYMEDYWGVSGSQGSSDLADEGYPLIGELPYAAVWVARGVLLPDVDHDSDANTPNVSAFVWFKAERLSSAVRDANRPEAACVKGAGCVVTWQEDPDGIRPGEGEGPGEGWSGAIAHHETDTWYSYIGWSNFALVGNATTDSDLPVYGTFYNDTGSLADWIATEDGRPKASIPMSIPVRLTDNAMCTDADGQTDKPYCYIDFDDSGTADLCSYDIDLTIETPTGTQNVAMCVAEDGRLMRGNTASTRARLNLHGYSSTVAFETGEDADNSDFFNAIDSAWFSMSYEENKGLGEEEVDNDSISPDDPTEYTKVDMGKNVWYHTFDMFNPEVGSQGLMLNQPAIYPEDFQTVGSLVADTTFEDYNFMLIEPDPVYETLADLESTLYQSEIARRPSPITQNWYDALTFGTTRTVALQLWKQGIIRRGGPADIMGRQFVIPEVFDSKVDNPYDYANMACDDRAYTDGTNPRYVKGLCGSPAINLSGNSIVLCDVETTDCAADFPFNEYFDDADMSLVDKLAKVTEWQQFGVDYGVTLTDEDENSLDDTSWANPYDVAKGHRGFMTGDMILAMYAWSPNWMANTVGHDNYNLYARRSFDGGKTWTTTPDGWAPESIDDAITWDAAGTTTCEWMGPAGSDTEYSVCTTYDPGKFEQARNLSQLVGTRETILDPRYSPTTASITADTVPDGLESYVVPYGDDTRNPSRFFMVYETGDNTTVAVGEAEPLDLFYSRAVNWGDDYLVWAEEGDMSGCLPDAAPSDVNDPDYDPLAGSGFCNEFDALEGSSTSESGEASITSSPGGQFFYAVWNQVDFDRKGEEVGSDAWFRRVLFLEGYVPGDDDGDEGGGDDEPDPPKNKKK